MLPTCKVSFSSTFRSLHRLLWQPYCSSLLSLLLSLFFFFFGQELTQGSASLVPLLFSLPWAKQIPDSGANSNRSAYEHSVILSLSGEGEGIVASHPCIPSVWP